jgi:ribonuclease HI
MSERPIVAFSDGASKGNPGPGGWGVVIVAPDGAVTEVGGHAAHTTNNKMELTGAIAALGQLEDTPGPVAIYTDSTYVIKGINEWIWGWRRRGWKTAEGHEVLNRELWEELARLVEARGKGAIAWHYVRGHVGTPGNERVDEIADTLARGGEIDLYCGPLTTYGRAILDLPADTTVPKRSASSAARGKSSAKPHAYLSLVDGELMRHSTWAECERRVKGRSGARFKKAMDPAEEVAILREWQIDERR